MAYFTNPDILQKLRQEYMMGRFRGNTVELQGVQFRVTEPEIIPETINQDYIEAEIEWYESCDRRVSTLFSIYGQEVQIWKNIADASGEVNSNYGWCIYSRERGRQYIECRKALEDNPLSRQAVMYYTVPKMHQIAGKDHTCTYAVQYFLNYEDDTFGRPYLDAHVYMRSNDAVYGFNNDYAWQSHVQCKLANDLGALIGDIVWNAGSFHVYDRHFDKLMGDQYELQL